MQHPMMIDEASLEALCAALEARKLKVKRAAGGAITVQEGVGLRAQEATLELSALERALERAQPAHRAGLLRACSYGVKGALVTPARAQVMDQWTYEQVAGKMFLGVVDPGLDAGVQAVTGSPCWRLPIDEDLGLMAWIELEQGRRPITQAQAQRWGVTDDRVQSAARSMLYHRTRDVITHRGYLGHPEVQAVALGDGLDAARCVVICDVLFGELDEFKAVMAMPHPDLLLLAPSREAQALAQLQAAAWAAYEAAEHPLSPRIYALERGRPRPLPHTPQGAP